MPPPMMTTSAVCIADSVREQDKRRTEVRRLLSPLMFLCSLAPAREIFFLLRCKFVDLYSHRLELELGHFLVDIHRNRIDLLLQRAVVLHHIFDGERLVGEAHVHHAGGVALGSSEVDEPSLAEQIDLA